MHVIICVQLAGDCSVGMILTHTCTAFLEGQDLQVQSMQQRQLLLSKEDNAPLHTLHLPLQ